MADFKGKLDSLHDLLYRPLLVQVKHGRCIRAFFVFNWTPVTCPSMHSKCDISMVFMLRAVVSGFCNVWHSDCQGLNHNFDALDVDHVLQSKLSTINLKNIRSRKFIRPVIPEIVYTTRFFQTHVLSDSRFPVPTNFSGFKSWYSIGVTCTW